MIYDSSATTEYHIVKNAPVPSGGALKVVSGQKVVLNGDDEVRVYATAATVDVICSILEDVS
jgi:ribosomal protein L6P/L9E